MAALVNSELPDYILNDLIPMEEEIDNWVNHDFWYTNQCIDHYDTDFSLTNVPSSDSKAIPKSTPVESYCAPQPLTTADIDSNVFMGSEPAPQFSSIPTLKVEVESPASSIYMVQNEPTVFVPSPTIPIQSSNGDSGIAVDSYVTGSSSSSPVPSATPSEADSIYIQEGHMITFLKSDKGMELFAKAHGIPKEDLANMIESKKNGEDFYSHLHPSPTNNDERHDEDFQKRRRHRGTYSKSTCLKVIQFVKKGYSARAAAKKFGIPKSTVHNWLHEDVSTRPEKGHRKKDLHHEKTDEFDHDYNRNMNDLGHSLAQTSIKDEPKYSPPNGLSSLDQNICTQSKAAPITPQSTLIQLLTTNCHRNERKKELPPNIGFNEADIDNANFVIDDILHPDDWIGHEQWYKQQYHNHYNKDLANGKNRKSYGTYSNEHRKKATDFVKSGKTLSAASREFNIPKSTIHTWLNEGNVPCELPPELENFVVDEIEHSKDGHSSPSLAVIKKKAEEVAVPHLENFRPSFAWCRDFMKRHYMDRDDEVESKKIRVEDFHKKEAIDNLVSALCLNSNRKDMLAKINLNTGSSAESPSL